MQVEDTEGGKVKIRIEKKTTLIKRRGERAHLIFEL